MHITEQRPSFQSSELSRNSTALFAAADGNGVEITRRDGGNLILMTQAEADSRDQLLRFAGDLVIASTDGRDSLAEHLADRLPWMLALSPEDRETCAQDVLKAARASFSTGQAHLAIATLTSWCETARLIAAGVTAEPVEWLEDSAELVVERP